MSDQIVVDSACVIALEDIGALDILRQVYSNLVVPQAVAREVGRLPDWLMIVTVQNHALVTSLKLTLGAGESESIAYAIESGASLIVLDDHKARQIAQSLHLSVIGTLRILLRAKELHLIQRVEPLLIRLDQVHFHMSAELKNKVLSLAGELPGID